MRRVAHFIADWVLLPGSSLIGIAILCAVGTSPNVALFGGMGIGFVVACLSALALAHLAKLKERP